jgi:hypothetical protein
MNYLSFLDNRRFLILPIVMIVSLVLSSFLFYNQSNWKNETTN